MIEEDIYVYNKDEALLAIFKKDDEDPIIDPRIEETQNSDAVFTFSISINNPKWEIVNNPEMLYKANGKVFSTNFEGSFEEDLSSSGDDIVKVTAYERQQLLKRKYVRAWNSETGLPKIDSFMVEILSGGNLDLKNDDNIVTTEHIKGSSGYALDALLYGTGWTTGDCDVSGEFDLETEQESIYDNILKVQELWGGILIFDSLNKVIHHRDEVLYVPYNGYEVKYGKNIQSLNKLYNNKVITKLCVLGEGGLNIKSVNNDSEWLTDYSYTTTVLEGIENNSDITDAAQLKKWGERKLKELCKPSKELTVNVALLSQLKGYELETVNLNDIVDVINYGGVENDLTQLRIVEYSYGLWDYSDATVTLSDITLDSTDIFRKNVQATNSINNGTLESTKIISYLNSDDLSNLGTLKDNENLLLSQIIQNKSDLTKTDTEISASVEEVRDTVNNLTEQLESQTKILNELQVTLDGTVNTFKESGGINILKNSVGIFGSEYWEGTVVQYVDTDVRINNHSNSAIYLQKATIMQEVNNLKNGYYTLSFNYKVKNSNATTTANICGNSISLTKTAWTSISLTLNITDNHFYISFTSDLANSCLISDLILVVGSETREWTQNQNETTTDTVTIGKGIQVNSTTTNTYTRIDSDGNRVYNENTGAVVMEATDEGIYGAQVETPLGIIGGVQIQKIDGQTWISSIS